MVALYIEGRVGLSDSSRHFFSRAMRNRLRSSLRSDELSEMLGF